MSKIDGEDSSQTESENESAKDDKKDQAASEGMEKKKKDINQEEFDY